MSRSILWCIGIYQRILSPDHSFWSKFFFPQGYCKFYPSCSEYGKQSIKKHGFIRGIGKSILRILRCNPWHSGGYDLP